MRRTIVFSAGWTAFIVSWYVGCYFQGTTIPPSLTQGQQSKLLQFVPVIQNSADQNSQLTSWQSEEFLPRLKIELEEDDQIHVRSMPSKLNLSHGWSHNLDSERNDAWLATDQKVWKLMILFQHNLPMLEQAVASYRRASKHMARNIIIVDNSVKKEALHSNTLNSVVNHVIPTIRLLNFPELHNFMADIAIEQQLEFFFWAHADNYVLSASKGRDLGTDVIACMRQQVSKSPNWGMILFSYDHLAAFRTQTMAQVPWDPNIFQYGSECDVYGRIRDAGYDAKSCRVHLSYDMKRVLNITDTTPYLHVKRILDTDAEDKSGRNQWRENAMEVKETEWRKAMKLSSRVFHFYIP